MADDRPQCRQYREPFRGEAGVLFGKAGGRADTRTRLYTRKGLPPPVLGSLSFFSSEPKRSPGASGPLVVWTSIQEIPYPPIFIKRKSANYLGFRGYAPDASFPVPTRLASGKCGSICEGRGRPRMISTAFDPAFLSTRKRVPKHRSCFMA